jgi:hypothetical protein
MALNDWLKMAWPLGSRGDSGLGRWGRLNERDPCCQRAHRRVVLPLAPSDTGLVRGELDPELYFNLPDNYSLTLSGQARFGNALVGGSAGANLRKQW